MDTNLTLFNQINSLCYWLLISSDYKSSAILNAQKDSYSVNITKSGIELYSNSIEEFSKTDPKFLEFELKAIVSGLLRLKKAVEKRKNI